MTMNLPVRPNGSITTRIITRTAKHGNMPALTSTSMAKPGRNLVSSLESTVSPASYASPQTTGRLYAWTLGTKSSRPIPNSPKLCFELTWASGLASLRRSSPTRTLARLMGKTLVATKGARVSVPGPQARRTLTGTRPSLLRVCPSWAA